jgi:hypothetical protein
VLGREARTRLVVIGVPGRVARTRLVVAGLLVRVTVPSGWVVTLTAPEPVADDALAAGVVVAFCIAKV